MTWLTENATLVASLARMVVKPGATTPAHRHVNCTEAMHALTGVLDVRLDHNWTRLAAGETLIAARGVVHQLRNPGAEEAELIVCYDTADRAYEEVE